MQIDGNTYDLAVEQAKLEMDLFLAIPLFDESKHKRDTKGRFTEKLSALAVGDKIRFSSPVHVTRTNEGFEVHVGKGRARVVTRHATEAAAAKQALKMHRRYKAKEVITFDDDSEVRQWYKRLGYGTPGEVTYALSADGTRRGSH